MLTPTLFIHHFYWTSLRMVVGICTTVEYNGRVYNVRKLFTDRFEVLL